MFRQIVLALSATAALSAAVLVPTTSSALPMPPSHRLSGSPGGVFTHIGAAYWMCRHSWNGRSYDCHWVPRGGGFVGAGR
jgi:hypothetical protein